MGPPERVLSVCIFTRTKPRSNSSANSILLSNMSSYLPILHFNDVYRVTPQKISKTETIDVTQFAALADDLRDHWPQRPDGKSDGLFLFSGDAFSPSVESSVTRGSHMVILLLHIHCSIKFRCLGPSIK